jgi:hypothetical protein
MSPPTRDLVADAETTMPLSWRLRTAHTLRRGKKLITSMLAVLAQVLRHRELDLIARALAQRQSGLGSVRRADQRRVFAKVRILELAALDAEGVEVIARPVLPNGSADNVSAVSVLRSDDLRGDLTRGAQPSRMRDRCRPLERAGQRHRDVVAVQSRFGGDGDSG